MRTRHPANESVDAIRLVDVVGATLDGGVNRAEITAVAIEVQRLAAAGVTSIGVVSPFRAQADALEAMLLDRFDVDGSAGSVCGSARSTPSRVPNATSWWCRWG